jgi:molybdenum cofactor cytidylyltransferase
VFLPPLDRRGAPVIAERTICAIVPAAGRAERFGSPKAIVEVEGVPMLERVIGSLRDAEVDHIVVVLGAHEDLIRENVPSLATCRVVVNPRPERGMFSSLQEGFNAAPAADAYLVAVGDMPFVRAETIRMIVTEHARVSGIVSPRYRGKRGHPIVVDGAAREAILVAEATPKYTLHDVVKAQAARQHDLEVDDPGVIRDVDTMTDLEPV